MANLIEWSPKYNVGNFVIDHQHKKLVSLINNLNEVVEQKVPNQDLLEIYFQDLANYVKFHFTTEENAMRACHYSGFEEHQNMHNKFIEIVKKLKIETEMGEEPTGKKLCDFLKDWLLTHIAVEDNKLVNELVKGDYLAPVKKYF
jgi:hemerythrin